MAGPPLDRKKDATYHAIATTAEWVKFVAALKATVERSVAARLRADAERQRETTYARGVEGGH
jgi:hypothetical protein